MTNVTVEWRKPTPIEDETPRREQSRFRNSPNHRCWRKPPPPTSRFLGPPGPNAVSARKMRPILVRLSLGCADKSIYVLSVSAKDDATTHTSNEP